MPLSLEEFIESWIYKRRRKGRVHPRLLIPEEAEKAGLNIHAFELDSNEKPIMVYFGGKNAMRETYLFTTLGIRTISNTKLEGLIKYKDIEKSNLPDAVPKMEMAHLELSLINGRRIALPVSGKTDGYLDVFTVADFLNRLLRIANHQ